MPYLNNRLPTKQRLPSCPTPKPPDHTARLCALLLLLQAAADSLTAKLLEQIMPGLKQHVQEALASGKGGLNLQEVLQVALQQEVRSGWGGFVGATEGQAGNVSCCPLVTWF